MSKFNAEGLEMYQGFDSVVKSYACYGVPLTGLVEFYANLYNNLLNQGRIVQTSIEGSKRSNITRITNLFAQLKVTYPTGNFHQDQIQGVTINKFSLPDGSNPMAPVHGPAKKTRTRRASAIATSDVGLEVIAPTMEVPTIPEPEVIVPPTPRPSSRNRRRNTSLLEV